MSKKTHEQKNKNRMGSYENVIAPQGSAPETPVTMARASFENDSVPSQEEVRNLAYSIHEQKGGSDIENWLEAESILREEYRKGA